MEQRTTRIENFAIQGTANVCFRPIADISGLAKARGVKSALAAASIVLLFGCSASSVRQHEAQMDMIESKVRLPVGAHRLKDYARYYAADDEGRIVGTYTTLVDSTNRYYDLPVGRRRWLESDKDSPAISDGGCAVVSVLFDPRTQMVELTECNGQA